MGREMNVDFGYGGRSYCTGHQCGFLATEMDSKDTKSKCRHLKKLTLSRDFAAVCWHCEQFCNILSGSPPHPPPPPFKVQDIQAV
jgi:hypothetical protein